MLVVFFWEGGCQELQKRAKERQNRSSDELVMAKTRISRSQYLHVTDVRERTDVRGPDVWRARKSVNLARVRVFRSSGKLQTSSRSGGSGRP